MAEAAAALGTQPGQIAKTLLLKSPIGFSLLVAAGDTRFNTKKAKSELGQKFSFADAEEVLEQTGFAPGGVCPFGLKTDLPIYLDTSLKRYEVIYPAAGTPNSAVAIAIADLETITLGKWFDLCSLP